MRKIRPLCFLFLLTLFSSCGKGSGALNQTTGAIQSPEQTEPPYGSNPDDPPRESLRFPAFQPSWGLKRAIYEKAVAYYEKNRAGLPNPRYATLIDFSQHSSKKRLYLFDLSGERVARHNTSHGKNSDPDDTGYANKFSNEEGSLMSSLGIYHTVGTYTGDHGYSLRLIGLESTNDNALKRLIVVHPADYVSDAGGKAGRSWGCPALDPKISKGVIDKIKNGSMLLIGR